MSNSVRPHRRQPIRLPRPWDYPDKNTGVGCHFLLQCMKVKHESEVAQLCLTLSDTMDCSLPGSSIHGIFQARVLEWGATAFSEPMFIVALFTITRQQQKPKHSLTDEWMDKHTHTHSQEYHSALKRMEILTHTTTWINSENIMLSKISQSQKDKCMISLT